MGAERVLHHLQLAVVDHLAQGHRFSQVPVLERLDVVAQLAVAAHGVCLAVFVGKYLAEPTLLDQLAHPRLHVFRVAGEILQSLVQDLTLVSQLLILALSNSAQTTILSDQNRGLSPIVPLLI